MAKIFSFLLLSLSLSFAFASLTEAGEINKIRLGSTSDDSVRLVVELTEKPLFTPFLLKNPYRIVIDMENTDIAEDVAIPAYGKGFISAVRVGVSEKNSARIVADLNTSAVITKTLVLPPSTISKWRLSFDIKPISEEDFDKSIDKQKKTNNKSASPKKNAVKMKKPLIMIDPGHGGKDPGAISVTGTYEKHITLQMAKELQNKLLKTGKYNVLLTRDRDKALALRQRVQIARDARADIFISIHADSARNRNAKGLSVYTLSEISSDREAAELAERENKADAVIGMDFSDKTPEVATILIDLARRNTMNNSSVLADHVVKEMKQRVKVLPDAHRFAGFAVLKAPDIPSILVEIGYLSNREEEAKLKRPEYRARLATAIQDALEEFLDDIDLTND